MNKRLSFALFYTLFQVTLLTYNANAQFVVKLMALDSVSKEPVPFAGIVNTFNKLVATTDLDGRASWTCTENEKFILKSTGYKNTFFTVTTATITLTVAPQLYMLEDVVILPGENPAHWLIWQAVKHRNSNNPQKTCKHCYNTYNKLVFKPDEDSLQQEAKMHQPSDSSFQRMKTFFDKQHLFITESLTEKYFDPPSKSSEKIIANRVSGFENPLFSILATELQSFGYYEDYIKLLGVKYLNPISHGSSEKYKFSIVDTTFDGNDTIYAIQFEPRKGKSFKGLKGTLMLHTRNFALKSIRAQPLIDETGFKIYINQLYDFVDNRQWFPIQLNAKLYLPSTIETPGAVIYGDNKGYITNIKFDEACESKKTDEIELEIVSTQKDTSIKRLSAVDVTQLDDKERNTYTLVDSVGKANHLDARLTRWSQLLDGKIPIGFVNLDLDKIYTYNHYEGSRLGLGLTTNYKISKRHTLGGYFAYGFKDKAFKYGGDLKLLLYPRKQTQVHVFYRNDVVEAAAPVDYYTPTNFLDATNARQLYRRKFDAQELWQVTIGSRVFRHFHVHGFMNVQSREPKYTYAFAQSIGDNTAYTAPVYYANEAGAMLRFGFREKFILADNKLISQGTKWPYLTVKYTQTINGLFRNDFTYNRIDVKLEKKMNIRNFGRTTLVLHAGKINGSIPYTYLSSFIAAYDKLSLSVPNAFETMRMNEFTANTYAMAFFSHNFLSNLFYNLKSKPQLELFTNAGWGSLPTNEQVKHTSIDIVVPSKGFYESGIRIHSLFRNKFSQFGIAVAYRYGPYSFNKFTQNAVIKLTTGFVVD